MIARVRADSEPVLARPRGSQRGALGERRRRRASKRSGPVAVAAGRHADVGAERAAERVGERGGRGLVGVPAAARARRRGSRAAARRPRAARLGAGARDQPSRGGVARQAAAVVVVGGEQQRAAVALGQLRRPRAGRAPRRAGRAAAGGSRPRPASGRRGGRRSSRVSPSSSTSGAQARASSTGLRSSRAMFSISASSSDAASSCGRTTAGTVLEPGELRGAPAALAGDQLVRPPGIGRTSTGCRTPRSGSELGQRAQRLLVEALARLARVGRDQLDRDLAQLARSRGRRRVAARPRRRGSPRGRGPCRDAQPRAATSLASSKYASEPAQCGSWWMTGRPKLGASPSRTLRGITVSKTSSGKCWRTSRSTSWASLVRAVVHRQQHPGDGQPRVELALDERQGVEQAGEALEREVLGLDRHDHPVGGDERVDGQRAERRRAVEQHVGVGVAQRRERVAQPRLGAGQPRQLHVRAGEVGGGGEHDRPLDRGRAHRVARRDARRRARRRARAPSLGRGRGRWSRCPAGRRRRAASGSRPRRCRRRR